MKNHLVVFIVFFCFNQAWAEMIVMNRGPESKADTRYEYDTELLRLALEKTKDELEQLLI